MTITRDGITVVVMTYNEAETLRAVVAEIHAALVATDRPFEIVVIDDGSRDSTPEVATELARTVPGLRVVMHPENLGLGSVYRTGLSEARQDLVTFFPADGQFPASIIGQFLEKIEGHDAVFGTLDNPVGPVGAILNRLERIFYQLLFGRFPRFQGIVMFRRKILDEVPLRSAGGRGWAVLMELILRISRGPYRFTNARTTLRRREVGRSKVRNLRTIWVNLVQAFHLRRLL
ncbi:MAG: glycosyltransferase family 2 protein [Vicinamibacteria bacterium]|nr:glycosyltransferase family 2 protein [Vicinamibacteria bacterium]